MSIALLIAAAEATGLISLLIWLLVFALVIYAVFLCLGMIPLPPPARNIVTIIVAVILLVILFSRLGFL